jgi:hypothetical protein
MLKSKTSQYDKVNDSVRCFINEEGPFAWLQDDPDNAFVTFDQLAANPNMMMAMQSAISEAMIAHGSVVGKMRNMWRKAKNFFSF